MKITFSVWLSVIVSACLGLATASPLRKTGTKSQTGPPLLALTLSDEHVSLVSETIARSESTTPSSTAETGSTESTTPSSTAETGSTESTTPSTTAETGSTESTTPSSTAETGSTYSENTFPTDGTSVNTEGPHSRLVRSATSQGNQSSVETTAAVPVTEGTTQGSIKEETTSVPVQEQTTAGLVKEETTTEWVKEETTTGLATEGTTAALVEVVLNQQFLDNASVTALYVLATVEYQIDQVGVQNYVYDELSRPMLPSTLRENAKQCVEIQPSLTAIREVLNDFLSHLVGLTTLNGDTSVQYAVLRLDWHIYKLNSPSYEYTPTAAPGTDVKNSEEVLCTLLALQKQCLIINHVLSDLKNC